MQPPAAAAVRRLRIGGAGAASAFGRETAEKAREQKGDLGREFGQGVSEAARQRKP